MRMHRNL
jgi:hypothetical protein